MPRYPDPAWTWWWDAVTDGRPYLIDTADHPHMPSVMLLQAKAYAQAKSRNLYATTRRISRTQMAIQAYGWGDGYQVHRPGLHDISVEDLLAVARPDPLITRAEQQAAQEAAAIAHEAVELEALCTCGLDKHPPSCRVWG